MIVGSFLLVIIGWACLQFARPVFGTRATLILMSVKVAAGTIAMVYYLQIRHEGDLFYYDEKASEYLTDIQSGYPIWDFLAQEADPAAKATPQNRTFFFVKIIVVLYMVLGSSIWLSSVFLTFISFSSVVYLVKRVHLIGVDIRWPVILIFFLWPSIAIWGSGLSKETLMLAGISILFGAVVPFFSGNRSNWLLHVALLVVAMVVLAKLRIFVLLSLLPFLFGTMLFKILQRYMQKPALRWALGIAGVISIVSLVVAFSYADTSFNPGYVVKAFTDNHAAIVAQSMPEHVVLGLGTLWEWPQIVLQAMWGAVAGMFGPFLWEVNATSEILLLLEPVLLLALFFTNSGLRKRLPVFIWMPLLAYILFTSSMITLSTPNYGSLSRYRLAFYPMLIFLASFQHPWLSKISKLKLLEGNSGV
ncbi:MAG: hypothetical protein ACMVP2_18085 [Imperialibacter sp.]|uniref:hypothetical protein n=1 Tax=Imperialibacter sp. TaxID=2038411 RepID=UPI003A83CE54